MPNNTLNACNLPSSPFTTQYTGYSTMSLMQSTLYHARHICKNTEYSRKKVRRRYSIVICESSSCIQLFSSQNSFLKFIFISTQYANEQEAQLLLGDRATRKHAKDS